MPEPIDPLRDPRFQYDARVFTGNGYIPLTALRTPDGIVFSRWQFTDDERALIASGASLLVQTMTFNQGLQPIKLNVVTNDEDVARQVWPSEVGLREK